MSGGVDSSVSAMLLSQAGYRAIGAHLRLWLPGDDPRATEKQRSNARDAQAVAEFLGIEFHVVDLESEFEREVVAPFVAEYLSGNTPNPCTICNPRIKLGALLDWAVERGALGVATGHYARVLRNPASGRWELRRGGDSEKDQTYFLCRLTQEKLARFRTPVGAMTKDAVRALARENGLPVAERSESQEICFIADDNYRRFLAERLGEDAPELGGPIVDLEGNELGRHAGIHHFTIGQRRGIGVSAPHPLYVVALRPDERAVVVGPADALLAPSLETGPVVWGALAGLDRPRKALVKIRYRGAPAPATLAPLEGGRRLRVDFDSPQRAITPGQTTAFYDETGEIVLGGARIERAL